MLGDDRVIETDSTLDANNSFTSETKDVYGQGEHIERVVGTVYADQPGTLKIQFDDGSGNWDGERTRDYTAEEDLGFNVSIVAPQFRIVYDNGNTNQSTFRLNAWQVT